MPREFKILGGIALGAALVGWLLFRFGSGPIVSKPVNDRVGAYSKGAPQAKVVLTEFADFQCPACRNAKQITDKLMAEYPQDLRLVFRHFPLNTIHPRAALSSEVAEAAGAQGKFWEMHDLLYAKQDEWGNLTTKISDDNVMTIFQSYAQQISLDFPKFSSDLKDHTYQSIVNQDLSDATAAGVNSTPSFFVNNIMVRDISYEAIRAAIDEALKK
jgi:protein-disulfide isomerase